MPIRIKWSPDLFWSKFLHSSQASAPFIIGTPNLLFDHLISSNLFFTGWANKLDISTCASFKILTAKYSEFLNNSNPSLKSPIQIKIQGGSKETDVNELAVNPKARFILFCSRWQSQYPGW